MKAKVTELVSYCGDVYERRETEISTNYRRVKKAADPEWKPGYLPMTAEERLESDNAALRAKVEELASANLALTERVLYAERERDEERGAWVPVTQELPPTGSKVIAFFKNGYGKPRRIMAFHAARWTIESSVDDSYESYEYSEEKDEYFLNEGWYENNEFDEVNWGVDGKVTHWMPLPEPPKEVQ